MGRLNGMTVWFLATVILVCLLLGVIIWPKNDVSLARKPDPKQRPNILFIVLDDVGYSDIGVYGGEINTPSIDALAKEGVQFSQFYTSPACSPTRSMLLTGVHSHLAGFGTMSGEWDERQRGKPGYEGHLNNRVVTLATIFKEEGYFTAMAGKWHLGYDPSNSPRSRGFERSFALLNGGASHFSDAAGLVEQASKSRYIEDDKTVTQLPDDFYSSTFYTDKMIEYIDKASGFKKPFFGYLSYTAAHWPLQVPDDALNLYKGVYDEGYEKLASERMKRIAELGLVSAVDTDQPLNEAAIPWDSLPDEVKRREARKMELYAAMIELMDAQIGKLLAHLKKTKLYHNTIIVLIADNGAEGNDILELSTNRIWVPKRFDNSIENMGRRNSYIFTGPGWAQASVAPFQQFKTFPHEGGIRVPAIISFSGKARTDEISNAVVHVRDIMPTILDYLEVRPPVLRNLLAGKYEPDGISLRAHLDKGEPLPEDRVLISEVFGRIAVRKGDWKALRLMPPYGNCKWQLFNIPADPGERSDQSETHPAVLANLVKEWSKYETQNHVILPAHDTGYANTKSGKNSIGSCSTPTISLQP